MFGYIKNLNPFKGHVAEDPFEFEKDEIMWYRHPQGLWNNHATYRWYKHKVAMWTDCRFSIHSSKIWEITQLIDEVEFIEKAINTVK